MDITACSSQRCSRIRSHSLSWTTRSDQEPKKNHRFYKKLSACTGMIRCVRPFFGARLTYRVSVKRDGLCCFFNTQNQSYSILSVFHGANPLDGRHGEGIQKRAKQLWHPTPATHGENGTESSQDRAPKILQTKTTHENCSRNNNNNNAIHHYSVLCMSVSASRRGFHFRRRTNVEAHGPRLTTNTKEKKRGTEPANPGSS